MIAVIGDIMLDKYIYGSSTRMSPECATAPVIKEYKTENRIGGAGNTALNIKNLNANVMLFCALSNGSELQPLLYSESLSYRHVLNYNKDVIKTRIVSNGEYVARIDYDFEVACEEDKLIDAVFASNPSIIIISDYNKGTISNSYKVIDRARELGIKTLVDPKKRLEEYKGASILKPNLKEFCEWAGLDTSLDEEDLINSISSRTLLEAMESLNVDNLIVTLGANGSILVTEDYAIKKINALPVKTKDVTGAGDSFIAALAVSLFENNNITKAITFATKVAGIAVTKKGTSYVKRNEI